MAIFEQMRNCYRQQLEDNEKCLRIINTEKGCSSCLFHTESASNFNIYVAGYCDGLKASNEGLKRLEVKLDKKLEDIYNRGG